MADVFFDFDMTLAYRVMMWTATVKELLLENLVVADERDIRPFTSGNGYPWNRPDLSHEQFLEGKSWWRNSQDFMLSGLVNGNICDVQTARRVAEAFPGRYIDLRYWRVFPDTAPVLSKLKNDGHRLHLLSNHVPEARRIISGLGLEPYFESMTISAEIGWEKPNPRIFRAAAANACGKKIMVGDNYLCDVEGGLQNGFAAILARVPNRYSYPYYCKTLFELPDVIARIEEEI